MLFHVRKGVPGGSRPAQVFSLASFGILWGNSEYSMLFYGQHYLALNNGGRDPPGTPFRTTNNGTLPSISFHFNSHLKTESHHGIGQYNLLPTGFLYHVD